MRYLSVCSGIEAATVAWHHMGWTPVGFSEIEPFPSKVLQHHYPKVRNHGDLTKHHEWDLPEFDLLVGGTPCQAFSIAGMREGLNDPRGNLTLTFLGLAARTRPKWILWENVPGVLSDRTNAFGSLLGGLGELGYSCAWRVLDAKHFGVPQRRRRVFLVGHLGDWRRAAAVLFEPQGVLGDPAAGREAGEEIAGRVGGGVEGCCTQGSTGDGIARCLTAGELKRGSDWETANYVTHAIRADGFDVSEDGTGRGTPLVPTLSPTLRAGGNKTGGDRPPGTDADTADSLIAYAIQERAVSENLSNGPQGLGVKEEEGYTLEARHHVQAVAFALRGREGGAQPEVHGEGTDASALRAASGGSSRDYLAFSCKDNGRDAGDTAPMGHRGSHANGGGQGAVAFNNTGQGWWTQDETAATVRKGDDAGGGGARESTVTVTRSAVRRITPLEAERLQGFPDGYTAIPGAKDGPRYKALGNSMAVPCMRWIGERIGLVERGPSCDVCGQPSEPGAYDEGDTYWCPACMAKWETENGQRWEDGQPK